MALIGTRPNWEMRKIYEEYLAADTDWETIESLFGKPPFYFEVGSACPVPPYNKFKPQYRDEMKREYMRLEEDQWGVRFRIRNNRNDDNVLPEIGTIVTIQQIGTGKTIDIRILSNDMKFSTRTATGWVTVDYP